MSTTYIDRLESLAKRKFGGVISIQRSHVRKSEWFFFSFFERTGVIMSPTFIGRKHRPK